MVQLGPYRLSPGGPANRPPSRAADLVFDLYNLLGAGPGLSTDRSANQAHGA